jgi:putative transposase
MLRQRRREIVWSIELQHECYRRAYAVQLKLIAVVDNWMRYQISLRRYWAIKMLSPIDYEQTLKATTEAS